MALDGITISCIINELNEKLLGGRIDKVYQPENDEIILGIRSLGNNYKLLLTASSSHPRIHITDQNKNNPLTAPLFCMVMRKHINNGKILEIMQPNFERIVILKIESSNEMGDLTVKNLIIEIMGKHSNIILTDENNLILDCIKHITHEKSSVREVLPGKTYVFPPSKDKKDPLLLNKEDFYETMNSKKNEKLSNLIYGSYNGISPIIADEILLRSNLDSSLPAEELNENNYMIILNNFLDVMNNVKSKSYINSIIYNDKNSPIDFTVIPLHIFSQNKQLEFNSISSLLCEFYKAKDQNYRIQQKSIDLRKLIQQNIERCVKKGQMQAQTMKEIKNRDTLKLYGELITAHIYSIKRGDTSLTAQNFYSETMEEITIPLDSTLSPSENAQNYFKKYNKEKRTYTALLSQMQQTKDELNYFEQLLTMLQTCEDEADLEETRLELQEEGYIKKRKLKKGEKAKKTKPLSFVSSDGFEILVGKNNKQNEELTLKIASNSDMWMHTKTIPGSHVIIRATGKEIPTATLNEAANLAAYYSKGRNSSLVAVDYTLKKNVKKPSGAKTGMVIYENYHTAYVNPNEEIILNIKK